jgi:hypothetical protein
MLSRLRPLEHIVKTMEANVNYAMFIHVIDLSTETLEIWNFGAKAVQSLS